jgi:hypothetical protein
LRARRAISTDRTDGTVKKVAKYNHLAVIDEVQAEEMRGDDMLLEYHGGSCNNNKMVIVVDCD